MEFIRTEGTKDLETALISALDSALTDNNSVLWLVPGGSNIAVAVRVMAALDSHNLQNLTVALTDERFGPIGHVDSNYLQLHSQGFLERGALFIDLLHGASFEETVVTAAAAMKHAFENSEIIIGFFGMGTDGHIAGILPRSPAAVPDETWMIGYDGGQFQRFSLTPFALSHVQKAFLGAYGEEKLEALNNLHDKMLAIVDQPVQLLHHIPEVVIYNDQIEGKV